MADQLKSWLSEAVSKHEPTQQNKTDEHTNAPKEAREAPRVTKKRAQQAVGRSLRDADNRRRADNRAGRPLVTKYARPTSTATEVGGGKSPAPADTKDKKMKRQLRVVNKHQKIAQQRLVASELLLPSQAGFLEAEGLERTFRFRQRDILEHVPVGVQRKVFSLALPNYGPYALDFTQNGRWMLLGGAAGHVALLDWEKKNLRAELQLRETVHDVQFLHDNTMFAVAQKKYVFVYDAAGTELHCLKHHRDPFRLQFLPYHFLLASVGRSGWLCYQDISTGDLVAQLRTKAGPCSVLAQNPWNAILCTGHSNGVLQMWSPNLTDPVVKLLDPSSGSRSAVQSVAINRSGHYLAAGSESGRCTIWDIRRSYKPLHVYHSWSGPVRSVDFSDRDCLAVASNTVVECWSPEAVRAHSPAPYLSYRLPPQTTQRAQHTALWSATGDKSHIAAPTQIRAVRFCPYQDVLGIAHTYGYESIVVPGAGEANFDSFEANPFQTLKQRQESEVHRLLDKIPAHMISLDPTKVGAVAASVTDTDRVERRRVLFESRAMKTQKKLKRKAVGAAKKTDEGKSGGGADDSSDEGEANDELVESNRREKVAPGPVAAAELKPEDIPAFDPNRKRARGRNSSLRRYMKKQTNVVDRKREQIRTKLEKLDAQRAKREGKVAVEDATGNDGDDVGHALQRFVKKPRKV